MRGERSWRLGDAWILGYGEKTLLLANTWRVFMNVGFKKV